MHSPSPTKVFSLKSWAVLALFLSVSGLALFCIIAELSRLLYPFQNSLVAMALIWKVRAMCLHILSSVNSPGPILHALIPIWRQKGPPTNLSNTWINSVLYKLAQYGLTYPPDELPKNWMFKVCLKYLLASQPELRHPTLHPSSTFTIVLSSRRSSLKYNDLFCGPIWMNNLL